MDALVDNTRSQLVDPFEVEDRVESRLIYHAKTLKVTLSEAYSILQEVESLTYKYKAPLKTSSASINRMGSQYLKDMSRPFFLKGPQY